MNPFELVCKLASEEQWCREPHCSDCGNSLFRYALYEIGRGASPDGEHWFVYKQNPFLEEHLGPCPADFSIDIKAEALVVCMDAKITTLANTCAFPDWLDFIGLALEYLHTPLYIYTAVYLNWTEQLSDIVPVYSPSADILIHVLEDSRWRLGIKELSYVKQDLMRLDTYS